MNTELQVGNSDAASGTGCGFTVETGPDNPEAIAYYAGAIREGLGKCFSSMMALARLCDEANGKLSQRDKRHLQAQLPFGKATFSKYAKVGADRRFDGGMFALPPKISMVYELSLLKDQDLESARADRIIHPDMRRADLLAWKKDRGVERGKRQRRMAKKHKDGDHITGPVHPDPGEGSGDGEPAGDPDDSFEALVSAWAASSELRAAWANAPLKARERFMTEVLQMMPLVPLH